MASDMTVAIDDGLINIRVGAIIVKDGKLLMMGNDCSDYLYTIGGRIKFGETAEEAVVREVLEETGVLMEIDRLGFVHENYFICDSAKWLGKKVYELSLYFYMKLPERFEPVCRSFTADGQREHFVWIGPDTPLTIYPDFFRTEVFAPTDGIKHFVTDDT